MIDPHTKNSPGTKSHVNVRAAPKQTTLTLTVRRAHEISATINRFSQATECRRAAFVFGVELWVVRRGGEDRRLL